MLSRKAKAAFYLLAGPVMWLNGHRYRLLHAPRGGMNRAHLGPGQTKYLPGWINVDANMFTAKCDVWADLRNSLPFRDDSLDAIYSHHVVEHLPDLARHFSEAYRCLKHGGVYRVGGPNGDAAIAKFVERDLEWFGDFPDRRTSIGGRFANFVFCRGEHLTILTATFLFELMENAGFARLTNCLPVKETTAPKTFGDALLTESESDFSAPHTLVVEGWKD